MALQKGTVNSQVCIVDSAATSVPVSDVTGDGGDIIAAAAAVFANTKLAEGSLFLSNTGRLSFGQDYYLKIGTTGPSFYNDADVELFGINYGDGYTYISTLYCVFNNNAYIESPDQETIRFNQGVVNGGTLLFMADLTNTIFDITTLSLVWSAGTKLTPDGGDGDLYIKDSNDNIVFSFLNTQQFSAGSIVCAETITAAKLSLDDLVYLEPKSSNILSLRNSTNPQAFNINRTVSGPVEEYLELFWYSVDNRCYIQTNVAGGGTHRNLAIGTAGATSLTFRTSSLDRWQVSSTGQFVATTDNALDIGISGNLRPRDIHLGRNMVGCITGTGSPTTTHFTQSGAWGIYKNASDVMLSYNDGGIIKSVTLT